MYRKAKNLTKVLMIGPDRSVHGGISAVVNNYYEAGLNQKVDLCYIGTMVEGSKLRKLWQAIKAFVQFCVKLPEYGIVHIHVASDSSFYRKSVFIKTAHVFGKRIVVHQHGGNFEEFYYRQLTEKGRKNVQKVLSMAEVLLVLSLEWKQFFSQITEESRITVFPNSIQLPQLAEKHYGQHKLLFLGRLCETKGIRELLNSVAELRSEYPDMKLYLGGIWEEKELETLAGAYPENVRYLGWINGEEKKKYLEECDIFVLPTYFEGQPVSVLEAMAFSCAVVASQVGGIPQMIEDGQTGILIKPKDEVSLQDGLLKVLKDARLCAELGANARKKVASEFSIEMSIEKLLQIYRKVSEVS